MAVVIYHASPGRLIGGFTGVDVFFVISGYLITGILLREADAGRLSIAAFYGRRVQRIFPAMILVLTSVLVAGWFILLADNYATLGQHVTASAGFVANLMFWSEASYFDVSALRKPLLHLWSLGVEEQFYFVWPLLLGWIFAKRTPLLAFVSLIAALSLVVSIVTVALSPAAAFFSPVGRLWELLAGALIVVMRRAGLELGRSMAEGASVVGLCLVVAPFLFLSDSVPFPGLSALPTVLGTALLIAAGPAAFVNRRLLSLPVVVGIGLISYPLYLWHWPLLSFASIINFGQTPPGSVRLAIVVTSIGLAWLTYRYIERPFRNAGPVSLLAAMASILAIGGVISAASGLPSRAANQDARRQFVAHYEGIYQNGQYSHRSGCDFLGWHAQYFKTGIDPNCTRGGAGGTVFLWGDSHAQSFSLGISKIIPADTTLAQVVTAGCRPDTKIGKAAYPYDNLACARSNRYALSEIARLKPRLVVIAQGGGHLEQDWEKLGAYLRGHGAEGVMLLGPLPQWQPSLPFAIVKHHWPLITDRVASGLDPVVLANDRALSKQSTQWRSLTFVSVVKQLCDSRGCLARVPGSLIAVDYGHLSPKGSEYIGSTVLRGPIEGMIGDEGTPQL